ncbi:MAG: Uma2 family endonuclease [Chloroflexota bacterium]
MATEVAPRVEHWQFTIDDYHKMAKAGIFTEEARVELIDGEIVCMSPIGGEHVEAVGRLTRLLVRAAGDAWQVNVQCPIAIPDNSEPEPDFSVVRSRHYAGVLPQPADVLLVIEVADTSLARDRFTKLPLYARTGLQEAWLVQVTTAQIERHTEPHDGIYRSIRIIRRGEHLESTVLPGLVVAVDEVFVGAKREPPSGQSFG